ncbi:Cytochrome oxidase complex assembly protein 1 [Prosthecobacter debontii]|uniref:Cytochrome oxidase complex assembly protein 1 n=1 Tax=Prosthecobacter debontii TaxID=48467 RepID=A0A1T4Y307_9BACT|nr:cytochrome c oxidase assembly factor Coa1 family protein [Prosthecobacter debontii]SKA96136.1 Cytochrome oxidase complex assembly protein 1 [Prosthecobacter debontii]
MNTEPPPFGDPTNIQRENAAAVRKGFAMGCGGCLAIILAAILFGAGIFGIVLYAIRSSDPVQMTLQAANQSAELKEELGEPITMGWFMLGSISTENDHGVADLSLSLAGPDGNADVHVQGEKKEGTWYFSKMEAITPLGKQVDLRKESAVPAIK